MPLAFTELASRAVIEIAGTDARPFLQGLVTNDVGRASSLEAVFAGLLSPQGKVLFDFLIVAADEALTLDVEAARADDLLARLKLYRLRAKVSLARRDDFAVFALWGGEAPSPGTGLAFPDPRSPALGMRIIGERTAVSVALGEIAKRSDEETYRRHRHALGIAEGSADLGIERVFALEANFEALNGVDFRKGCYVGQELTARMKHKTDLKKRVLPVRAEGPLQPGASLVADGSEIGSVTGADGMRGFAIVRLDRLEEADAAAAPVTSLGLKVIIDRPAFTRRGP